MINVYFSPHYFPAEFLTWVKITLKPSPNTVHYLLTHFKPFWNIINSLSFLRDGVMRYVLTCKCKYLWADLRGMEGITSFQSLLRHSKLK